MVLATGATPPHGVVMQMDTKTVDVAVVGAGTAGLAAYREARKHTPRVLLIEAGHHGTTCARVGCMPSKLLIAAGEAAHHARHAGPFGVHATVRVDGRAVMERVRRERDRFVGFVLEGVEEIPADHKLHGRARFLAPGVLEVAPGDAFSVGDVRVRVVGGNHPGGVLAYRLDLGDVSLVYATDTEHGAGVDPELRALAEGATLLIYDAQYTVDEYAGAGGRPARVGWGHSTNVAAAALARAAGVSSLALFHHDPSRDDVGVLALEAATRALFPATFAAREGMCLRLGGEGAPGAVVHTAKEAA